MIYIDDRKGWCHLVADNIEYLHRFAEGIGLKRQWFQDGKHPHYDLSPGKRAEALASGAINVSMRDAARISRETVEK